MYPHLQIGIYGARKIGVAKEKVGVAKGKKVVWSWSEWPDLRMHASMERLSTNWLTTLYYTRNRRIELSNVMIPYQYSVQSSMLKRTFQFFVSSLLLSLFCLAADYIVFQKQRTWKYLMYGQELRALCDCSVHGLISGWCWANYYLFLGLITKKDGKEDRLALLLQTGACIVLSIAVDIDHFIEAKSLSVKVCQEVCFFCLCVGSFNLRDSNIVIIWHTLSFKEV